MATIQSDGKNGPVPILGLPVEDKEYPPVRMEIRTMQKEHPKMWSLFLLGLESFKDSTDEADPLSYFQIGGIHGLPLQTWPNEKWNEGVVPKAKGEHSYETGRNKQFGGFCTHSSALFLPWHRPYLSLWETELWKHVNKVASDLKTIDPEYAQLARNFRMPYWDFCIPENGRTGFIPAALVEQLPSEARPDKEPWKINPLYNYKFRDQGKADPYIMKHFKHHEGSTVRHPKGESNKPDQNSLMGRFKRDYNGKEPDRSKRYTEGMNLPERALYIILAYRAFRPMCADLLDADPPTWKNPWGDYGSLEDIHNTIHDAVGGDGAMSNVPIAAFDPIFWMHHANIDRLFAIWQALWDDGKTSKDPRTSTYVTPTKNLDGTYSMERHDYDTVTTALTPFSKSEKIKDYQTSEDARYTTQYGYVYPENRGLQKTPRKEIVKALRSLYGAVANLAFVLAAREQEPKEFQSAVETLQARARSHIVTKQAQVTVGEMLKVVDDGDNALLDRMHSVAQTVQLPSDRSVEKLVGNNEYLEWLIDVKAEKHALDGDFLVHFFIGEPDDENPYFYVSDPRHVSFFSTFGSKKDTNCEKCQKDRTERVEVTGQIPLTMALVERYLAGHVPSLEPADVIPFLRDNLHWRVTTNNGATLHRGDVNGLLVGIVTNKVTLAQDRADLPVYADEVVPRPEVTTNRAGRGRGGNTGYYEGHPDAPRITTQ